MINNNYEFDSDLDITAKKSIDALMILDEAMADTPSFLNGVLLSPWEVESLRRLLRNLNTDEVYAKKYWEDVQTSIKQSEKFMGSMLKGLLNGEDVRDVTIKALSEKSII